MEREIKFRGKRIDNGEWTYGDLIKGGDEYFIHNDTCVCFRSTEEPSVTHDFIKFYALRVDPSTVGQYTGLKDKNGKEIYEGDMIRVLDRDWPSGSGDPKPYMLSISAICKVEYSDSATQYFLKHVSGGCWWNSDLGWSGVRDIFEIIGNIHGTPELLKEDGNG